jgi:hypothetical protein
MKPVIGTIMACCVRVQTINAEIDRCESELRLLSSDAGFGGDDYTEMIRSFINGIVTKYRSEYGSFYTQDMAKFDERADLYRAEFGVRFSKLKQHIIKQFEVGLSWFDVLVENNAFDRSDQARNSFFAKLLTGMMYINKSKLRQ